MAQLISNDYVISAILGNWWQESQLNPGIWENLTESTFDHEYQYDGIGGYGLGQWTNIGTSNGRLWNLKQYSEEHHVNVGDGGLQCSFFINENYWIDSTQSRLKYKALTEFISSNSSSLEDLTWDFCAQWEGVPGNQFEKRLDYAKKVFDYIQLHKNDSHLDYTWFGANTYIAEEITLSNAMCAYFHFADDTPTPDPPKPPKPSKKRKGMPLWMMLKWN